MPGTPWFDGPYVPENGMDAYGHLVNGFGRCEQLNANGGTGICPNSSQKTTYLMGQTVASNVSLAQSLGITLPTVIGGLTNAIVVPLIIAVLFP